jgi:DNA mismatch endonuclease (patch repair protein)
MKSIQPTPDTHSPAEREQISKRMRAVKPKDSKAELLLRATLWQAGYRYRKHYTKLPGTPDVVLVKHRIAIFCDGDFWHGRNWEQRKLDFKSNQDFWIAKIERNMKRDREKDEALRNLGWVPLHFWEKDILKRPLDCLKSLEELLISLNINSTE